MWGMLSLKAQIYDVSFFLSMLVQTHTHIHDCEINLIKPQCGV